MNRHETQALLRQVAATWPGTPITHEAVDLWHASCFDLPAELAARALTHWATTTSHPPRPADLNATARDLDAPPPEPRPEHTHPTIDIPPARIAPETAATELAKMRALLGERGGR